MSTTEPRALTAALSSPAFVTRGGALAMHVADRHVERWAPESGANRMPSLRNLGFVDRLVSPWIESAQRSASLRMFSQYMTQGVGERATAASNSVSWVFPRPWYQDELDWMAAARQVGGESMVDTSQAPSMLTTRGTYVAPAQRAAMALPSSLYEYVAPSLSVARPDAPQSAQAFSPLVSYAASQAAHVMSRAVAPIGSAMTPGLRAVLSTMLERAAQPAPTTRIAQHAPELVTPPAPRPDAQVEEPALQVAEQYAAQRAQISELQRMANAAAQRELVAREAVRAIEPARAPEARAEARVNEAEIRAAQARAVEARQAEVQRRLGDVAARREAERAATVDRAAADAAAAAERQRVEERIAQKVRLHEQSREAAVRDARSAPVEAARVEQPPVGERVESRVAAEIAAAVAALPPELASMVTAGIGQRPERAAQAIAELGEALRTVELIARNSAAGGSIESSRGPRLVMPAGLGGLVATVERTTGAPAQARAPQLSSIVAARAPAPTALGAVTSSRPAALQHVAWSDRWLARFAGARPQSLDVLSAGATAPELRSMRMLADAAPSSVFVAPTFEDRSADPQPSGGFEMGFTAASPRSAQPRAEVLPTLRGGHAPEQAALRFDDNAETPDDVLAAIATAATRSRNQAAMAALPPPPSLPSVDPTRYAGRETLADIVAHAAPSAPGAGLSAQLASSPFAAALRHVLPLGVAPTFDVRALFGDSLTATYLAGLVSAPADEISLGARDWSPTYVAPVLDAEPAIEERHVEAPVMTTLRSTLLSFDAPSAPLARTLVQSLTTPMLGEAAALHEPGTIEVPGTLARGASYVAPGMIADRAHAWSAAHERSASDLSYDFVTPELVLAARVYGLGPAEAAQAARLAVAGPGQLSAMASAVDRTFVQAMAIEAERRGEKTARVVTAYPVAAGETASAPSVAAARTMEAAAAEMISPATFAPTQSAFGIERRAPRGAFLWPAATTAALGLNAAAPDGDHSMSVAALELLAAQSVAELGTYAALADERPAIAESVTSDAVTRSAVAPSAQSESDVLASASVLVPAPRREKFQALYLALSQSPSGRTASPAARAARALALAGRGEESVTARERATVAWDVLPVVYGMVDEEAPLSTGQAAARAAQRREELRALDPVFVDRRPGLANLSTRAGEALGSYVAPAAAAEASYSSSSSSSRGELGAVLRAPTAAQELVQTGRPVGRHGGGETEIPAWFEAAARKMFEDKSSLSDGISIAELTLVSAAPSQQIAASSRAPTAATPPVATNPAAAPGGGDKQNVDIEKLANDVYREVLVLMDIARARNGEPYL